MADGAAEIDLYDNIDEDFVQECSDFTEAYDDVLTQSSTENKTSLSSPIASKPPPTMATSHTGRRVAMYVGNLTWWTTDLDLVEACNSAGINDVVEVKFHENRQNGQSKGFCVIFFGSDQSARLAMDKLPKVDIHGQYPAVTHCTKYHLNIFEQAAEGDNQFNRNRNDDTANSTGRPTGLLPSSTSVSTASRLPPPLMATPTMPASLGFSLRNNSSLMGPAAPGMGQNTLQQSLLRQSIQSNFSTGHLPVHMPPASNVLMPPTIVPPSAVSTSLPGLFPSSLSLPSSLTTSLAPANAHINPMFLQQAAATGYPTPNLPSQAAMMQLASNAQTNMKTQFDPYGRPVIHTYTPSSAGKLSETEFEDILQRNKTVSSSAINRAVQDAAGGNYASAIETLVTAISLIRQSKIANDDRCRILINSLQDTLHGIESKSYGAKSTSRHRRRSYSDSGSENGLDGYDSAITAGGGGGGSGGGSSSRRHRDRDRERSRSRDHHHHHHSRRDRHRRSRDRISGGSSYYGGHSDVPPAGVSPPNSTVGNSSIPGGIGNNSSGAGSSERYRSNRYRH